MEKQKQEKFEEFYVKFVRKCLTEDILPVAVVEYKPWGIIPVLNYREVAADEKKQILSSLIKEE